MQALHSASQIKRPPTQTGAISSTLSHFIDVSLYSCIVLSSNRRPTRMLVLKDAAPNILRLIVGEKFFSFYLTHYF